MRSGLGIVRFEIAYFLYFVKGEKKVNVNVLKT